MHWPNLQSHEGQGHGEKMTEQATNFDPILTKKKRIKVIQQQCFPSIDHRTKAVRDYMWTRSVFTGICVMQMKWKTSAFWIFAETAATWEVSYVNAELSISFFVFLLFVSAVFKSSKW